ncbi:MAG: PAS domain S-box protein, partial [Planctomycetota bacterium]
QLEAAHGNLAKSEERYRTLFNNANDAIFLADTKKAIMLDCNKEAENLLGRSKQEIIGMPVLRLHPPQKKKYYNDFFRRHVNSGRINDPRKAEVITKDGITKPVYISASVMELDGQKVIQGIFRDVSQCK